MSFMGKTVRLRRTFDQETEKCLIVALDHAIGWGVIPGLENLDKTLELVVKGRPDALIMMKGTASNAFARYAGFVPFILKVTTFSPYHPTHDALIGSVSEAIRLGAEAIAVGVTVCGDRQAELLTTLGILVKEAEEVGLPTVAHIYPKGELIEPGSWYSVDNVRYAARAAAELGASIVKTFYTGSPETFSGVIEAAAPARVVVSGGAKLDKVEQVFAMTRDAMDAGACGVAYGRNVWQSQSPVLMMEVLRAVIHRGLSTKDAVGMWNRQWMS